MDNEKYKYEINDLNLNDGLVRSFNFKPKTSIYMSIIIGIVCAFTPLWVINFFIVPLAIYSLFFLPDYKVIDIFKDSIVIYSRKDNEHVTMVKFDEIKTWTVKQGGPAGDQILIQTMDDQVIGTSLFSTSKFFSTLNKIIPEKEARTVRRKEMEKNSKKYSESRKGKGFSFFKKKQKEAEKED